VLKQAEEAAPVAAAAAAAAPAVNKAVATYYVRAADPAAAESMLVGSTMNNGMNLHAALQAENVNLKPAVYLAGEPLLQAPAAGVAGAAPVLQPLTAGPMAVPAGGNPVQPGPVGASSGLFGGKLSAAALAGICAGAAVVVAAAVLACCCCYCRRKNAKTQEMLGAVKDSASDYKSVDSIPKAP
jgi:hypothetical protein